MGTHPVLLFGSSEIIVLTKSRVSTEHQEQLLVFELNLLELLKKFLENRDRLSSQCVHPNLHVEHYYETRLFGLSQ